MSASDLVIRSRRVVTPEGLRPAGVAIKEGRIAALIPYETASDAAGLRDFGDSVVMAGLVDTHVHVNEPGRTAWEGFETATRAAAAGGLTTIVDMPLNCDPVTTTLSAFRLKERAARGLCLTDYGFWGGIVPGNTDQLEPMMEAGALGFKAFMIHSGIDDFPASREEDLRAAMAVLARLGVPLLVHAELEREVSPADEDPRRYSRYLQSRPKSWENAAIELLIRLCRQSGCRVHIVHLSSSEALPLLAAARREGLPLTAETCPHYLSFCAEEIPDGRTEFKCSPPIRESENREKLWQALGEGLIDFVVSDHSPCLPELKRAQTGDFEQAWGGVSSLQFLLPAVWTQARNRGFRVEDLSRWLCERPAAFAGLGSRKGRLAPGLDADLTAWNPEASFKVEASFIRHRHKVTPYLSQTLHGVIEATFLRGLPIYEQNKLESRPRGEFLAANGHAIHRTR